MVSSGGCLAGAVDPANLKKVQNNDSGSHAVQQISDMDIHESQSHKKERKCSTKTKEAPRPGTGVLSQQSDQDGSTYSVKMVKTSVAPDKIVRVLPGTEAGTPIIREKVPEDGYSWRKYGQKLVKGNEFVRSYYKCTHPNCQVKKQLERTHDGQIVDTVYFGPHDHPKPQNLPLAVGFVVSIVEERSKVDSMDASKGKSCDAHDQKPHPSKQADIPQPLAVATTVDAKTALSQSRLYPENDDNGHPVSKRRRKDSRSDVSPFEKPSGEPRVVVKTMSDVDIVNDGYRWRKYGQKLVKGSPNPRSYYRCSSPGCPVKKHVERASHDVKLIITTYEGRHDHDMPPIRTGTPSSGGLNVHRMAHADKSCTKLEDKTAVSVDMVIHSGSGPENQLNERISEASRAKSEVSAVCAKTMNAPAVDSENRSNKQQTSPPGSMTETDSAISVDSNKNERSDEQVTSKPESKPEKTNTVFIDKMVHNSPPPDCNFDEQRRVPNAESVRS